MFSAISGQSIMSKSPLEVLKTGLAELKKRVKARKDDLLARLGKKEKLTDKEVEWLDHTANFGHVAAEE
jgi:hypothetical protein